MKIFDIVQLNFKQLIRDKKNLFFLLLFPAVFMLIFGIGFGDNVESDVDIAVINHDNASGVNLGNELVGVIKDFNPAKMKVYLQFMRLAVKIRLKKCWKTDLFLQF